ncbi:MAG: hypothetical protein P3B98_11780 [Gemmatimonadota bacterium]|nr:hypothetical protein [Gemmatimonadota bacterium]
MPLVTEVVQRPVREVAIPDALGPAAQVLAELLEGGAVRALGESLRLSRKGGFTGVPLVAFVLAFLASTTERGVRPFIKAFKRPLQRVAAVAGCTRFPSSASVSRAFTGIDQATAERFADVALSMAVTPGLRELLTHPTALHRDSRGDSLCVLDIDPSVQAFRQRDLIAGEDFPAPDRVAPGVAGYTGHHRGEIRIRHVAVCAAGPGVWLGYRMSEDNQHLASLFTSAIRPALSVTSEAGIPLEQVLLRGDGEFGSAGVARAIVGLGVQLLVRISRYGLLDRPEVLETLRIATWEQVPAGAKRVREATDLGTVLLHPSAKSADAGEPGVSLRVVVCRRKVPSESDVHYGAWHDGYQMELFGTTLPADRWPARDVVALYGGRSAIENRFAQEDRELRLGRTFTYNAFGQAVFTALGLFLWNYRTCSGFREAPSSAVAPLSERVDLRVPDTHPSSLVTPPAPPQDLVDGPLLSPEQVEPQLLSPPEAAHGIEPAAAVWHAPVATEVGERDRSVLRRPAPADPFPGATDEDRTTATAILTRAFDTLANRPGWSLDDEHPQLRCPNGKRLFPFSVTAPGRGRPMPQVIIRTDVGACDGCPMRLECFASDKPNSYKQVARAISPEDAAFVAAFLNAHPPSRRLVQRTKTAGPPNRRTAPPRATEPLIQLPATSTPGPWECAAPTMTPADLRRRAVARYEAVRVEIRIGRAPRRPPSTTTRRRTWADREARWRHQTTVTLTLYVRPKSPIAKHSQPPKLAM